MGYLLAIALTWWLCYYITWRMAKKRGLNLRVWSLLGWWLPVLSWILVAQQPYMILCPYCRSTIRADAAVCRHCTRELSWNTARRR